MGEDGATLRELGCTHGFLNLIQKGKLKEKETDEVDFIKLQNVIPQITLLRK